MESIHGARRGPSPSEDRSLATGVGAQHHLDLCRWLIGCKAERVMAWERFHAA